MRRRKPAYFACLCATIMAVTAVLSGCGGGTIYDSNAVASGGVGDTPPPPDSRNSWSTSFESSEGYQLGDIDGQQDWQIGANPHQLASAFTVCNDRAATGSNCLKLDCPSSFTGTWEENLATLIGPSVVPDVPLNSVIVRMKLWRSPDLAEYPNGSNSLHPSTESNQFLYYPSPIRYMDLGDAEDDLRMHALLLNTAPRTYDDPGWQVATGRFAEIVIYDNFKAGTRVVWYDGRRVAVVPISNDRMLFRRFVVGYQSGYPHVPATLGKPMYIDDVIVNWEPSTAIRTGG